MMKLLLTSLSALIFAFAMAKGQTVATFTATPGNGYPSAGIIAQGSTTNRTVYVYVQDSGILEISFLTGKIITTLETNGQDMIALSSHINSYPHYILALTSSGGVLQYNDNPDAPTLSINTIPDSLHNYFPYLDVFAGDEIIGVRDVDESARAVEKEYFYYLSVEDGNWYPFSNNWNSYLHNPFTPIKVLKSLGNMYTMPGPDGYYSLLVDNLDGTGWRPVDISGVKAMATDSHQSNLWLLHDDGSLSWINIYDETTSYSFTPNVQFVDIDVTTFYLLGLGEDGKVYYTNVRVLYDSIWNEEKKNGELKLVGKLHWMMMMKKGYVLDMVVVTMSMVLLWYMYSMCFKKEKEYKVIDDKCTTLV